MASNNSGPPDIMKAFNININYPKLAMVVIVLLILDYIWITKVSNNLYVNTINNIQTDKFKMDSSKYIKVILAYIFVIYLLATSYDKSLYERLFTGLAVYGLFNFTNAAMFDNWTYQVALTDTAWGTALFALIPIISNFLGCGDKKLIN